MEASSAPPSNPLQEMLADTARNWFPGRPAMLSTSDVYTNLPANPGDYVVADLEHRMALPLASRPSVPSPSPPSSAAVRPSATASPSSSSSSSSPAALAPSSSSKRAIASMAAKNPSTATTQPPLRRKDASGQGSGAVDADFKATFAKLQAALDKTSVGRETDAPTVTVDLGKKGDPKPVEPLPPITSSALILVSSLLFSLNIRSLLPLIHFVPSSISSSVVRLSFLLPLLLHFRALQSSRPTFLSSVVRVSAPSLFSLLFLVCLGAGASVAVAAACAGVAAAITPDAAEWAVDFMAGVEKRTKGAAKVKRK